MYLYEKERSNLSNYIYHQNDFNLSFPLHIHNSFEFVVVFEGELEITIENQTYQLTKNKCALILPNQIHSYSTKENSKSYLCIFSNDLVNDFYNKINKLEPVNPLFKITNKSLKLIDDLQETNNLFKRKSVLYYLVSLFYEGREFKVREEKQSDFIHISLNYIENNFMYDIELKELSKSLGYDYNYTSSLFNKTFNVGFSSLVNEYRINKAIKLLSTTDHKISDISSMCGFNSLRAFNRNFIEKLGITPTNYRNQLPIQR